MKPISDARTCGDGCTYLRERLYEGAFFRKRLLERMQCFAGAVAMLCVRDGQNPSSGVLPSRQPYLVCLYPCTPPPSVYQVTHGSALQAPECYVSHHVL